MSPVMCHLYFLFWGGHKLVELVGGGSVINGAYPVHLFLIVTSKLPFHLLLVHMFVQSSLFIKYKFPLFYLKAASRGEALY